MNKEKFEDVAFELENLISDYLLADTLAVKEFAEKLIVEKARELIDFVEEENAPSRPAKSELARNCKCNKTPDNSDFQAVFETVKKTLVDWNGDEEFINGMAQLIFDRKKKG